MPTPSVEEVRAWLGRVMVDRDGNRLGEITDIYLDRETDRPEWAVVRTGLFGLRSSFVLLAEASEVGDQIQVPHERSLVKGAPNIEADGQLVRGRGGGALPALRAGLRHRDARQRPGDGSAWRPGGR
jgi:sporulation protein YlmC with PRC-barrel domain